MDKCRKGICWIITIFSVVLFLLSGCAASGASGGGAPSSVSMNTALSELAYPAIVMPGMDNADGFTSAMSIANQIVSPVTGGDPIVGPGYETALKLAADYGTPDYLNHMAYKTITWAKKLPEWVGSEITDGVYDVGDVDFEGDTWLSIAGEAGRDMGSVRVITSGNNITLYWTVDMAEMSAYSYAMISAYRDSDTTGFTRYEAYTGLETYSNPDVFLNSGYVSYNSSTGVSEIMFNYDFVRGMTTGEFDYTYCDIDVQGGSLSGIEFYNVHHGYESPAVSDSDSHWVTILVGDGNAGGYGLYKTADDGSVDQMLVEYFGWDGSILKSGTGSTSGSGDTLDLFEANCYMTNHYPISVLSAPSGYELHTDDITNPSMYWLDDLVSGTQGDYDSGTDVDVSDVIVDSDLSIWDPTADIDSAFTATELTVLETTSENPAYPGQSMNLDSTVKNSIDTVNTLIQTVYNHNYGDYTSDPTEDLTYPVLTDFPDA